MLYVSSILQIIHTFTLEIIQFSSNTYKKMLKFNIFIPIILSTKVRLNLTIRLSWVLRFQLQRQPRSFQQ